MDIDVCKCDGVVAFPHWNVSVCGFTASVFVVYISTTTRFPVAIVAVPVYALNV